MAAALYPESQIFVSKIPSCTTLFLAVSACAAVSFLEMEMPAELSYFYNTCEDGANQINFPQIVS